MLDYQRIILVTGSNTGIGLELVRILARKGHTVYLSARNQAAGLEAQSNLHAQGLSNVKFVLLDVTSPASVSAAKDAIEKAEGRLDSLINNAAISSIEQSKGALAEPIPAIHGNQPIRAHLPKLGYACIVSVSTTLGSNGYMAKFNTPADILISYNTSKAAVNSYTIALAKELAGEVKVNAVAPGFATTKLNAFAPGGKTAAEVAEVIAPWALLGPEDKDKTRLFWGPEGEVIW